MNRSALTAMTGLALLSAVIFSGCGSDSSSTQTADGKLRESSLEVQPPAAQMIAEYLEAVRQGDAEAVNRLLTSTARRKTSEMNIAVAPPGSDTAEYQVGSVTAAGDSGRTLHVQSRWADFNQNNEKEVYDITWIVRQEAEGWRVAGMMGEFIPGEPTMVFNFENPQEVIRQQDYAKDQLHPETSEPRQAQASKEVPSKR
ncbi:MAG: hypothetical protein VB853_12315 [Pirellulales bacterium]